MTPGECTPSAPLYSEGVICPKRDSQGETSPRFPVPDSSRAYSLALLQLPCSSYPCPSISSPHLVQLTCSSYPCPYISSPHLVSSRLSAHTSRNSRLSSPRPRLLSSHLSNLLQERPLRHRVHGQLKGAQVLVLPQNRRQALVDALSASACRRSCRKVVEDGGGRRHGSEAEAFIPLSRRGSALMSQVLNARQRCASAHRCGPMSIIRMQVSI